MPTKEAHFSGEIFRKSCFIDKILDEIGMRILHWKVFLLLCFLGMTTGLGTAILSAILPTLKSDWNISSVMAGVLTLSSSTGKIAGTTFWAWVSDEYGRKLALIGSAAFMFVFALVSAFSMNYYWLWISLSLSALLAIIYQRYVLIAKLFPKRYRSMFSVLTASFCINCQSYSCHKPM